MRSRPTPEDITDMLVRMEQAGWKRKGFAMSRAGHVAIVGVDGSINVSGPDDSVPKSVDEILDPLPGGRRKHDA